MLSDKPGLVQDVSAQVDENEALQGLFDVVEIGTAGIVGRQTGRIFEGAIDNTPNDIVPNVTRIPSTQDLDISVDAGQAQVNDLASVGTQYLDDRGIDLFDNYNDPARTVEIFPSGGSNSQTNDGALNGRPVQRQTDVNAGPFGPNLPQTNGVVQSTLGGQLPTSIVDEGVSPSVINNTDEVGAIIDPRDGPANDQLSVNVTGIDRYLPTQPSDVSGNPIARTNVRSGVLVQPNGSVTCGQHACGMALNTQGNPIAVDTLIRTHGPDFTAGSSPAQLQQALRDNGIESTIVPDASVADLAGYTSGGKPAIATVQTGPNTWHAVVVDGVTTRGGQRVIAIRDPAGSTNGGVYYETLSSFENRFTGGVIRMNNQ